jgi:2-oxoglutarate ferredoxin oxidoreductase subunit delta
MKSRRKRGNRKVQTGFVTANTRNCKACWDCIDACPKQAISKVTFLWHKHIVFKNPENCTGCRKCIKICPHGVFAEMSDAQKRAMEADTISKNGRISKSQTSRINQLKIKTL